ncbi:MAG: 3-methylcrotonyl-CoA carboxylase subunit alpha [Paracoccaceae bacterium]|nr:MAG: 3-methylcrotonyl-CoA carboxylase subunit alpha [Paracoccaceae bacterium]
MTAFLTAPRPIRTVLIANRGEIACRIIATCRRLGLRSIAVHSKADAGALHVRMADRALCIGPAAPADSYLNIAAIIAAARAGGADAVHPGYGFLSENAAFAQACAEAGLIFVGPDPAAVAAMGSKVEARRIAEAAGVPVVPGYAAAGAPDEALAEAAARIGYPVMVKASAGGGGRGMRRVDRPQDLAAALAAARAEAGAAFGDDTLFIEKLILAPRHVEVQVFGDGQGDAVHFHERDCSVQRNHQKLIEEAPAPDLPDAVRRRLFDHALNLARAIRYAGAGTVEFILERGGTEPFFLEMNTRLQVEHPVTEEICGVDLVEWQLRQAAGLPLPLRQDQIRPRGAAIEVRINAERPEEGFLPATGRLIDVVAPPGLRFDTGVAAGSEVGTHYDSLLAKLIAHGPDRDSARRLLIEGLERLAMPGVATGQAFLADCLRAPAFARGAVTTAFLAETFPGGWRPDPERLLALRAGAALAMLAGPDDPHRRTDGFRVTARHGAAAGRVPLAVSDPMGESEMVLRLGPAPAVEAEAGPVALRPPAPRLWPLGDGAAVACAGGLSLPVRLRPLAEARMGATAGAAARGRIHAPLAGLVTEVRVAPGDIVQRDAPLVVMEAMKLVHVLNAPAGGRITRVACAAGQTVGARAVLIEMEEVD